MSTAPAPALPSVTFEVDRFEWASDDRLEVVGRWFGLRGHRFLRPTLDVEVRGERRRMLAVLEHKPWAAEEGEEWVAAFAWTGEQTRLDDAELTVSPDLAVQLPVPDADEAAPEAIVTTAERLPARRPRTAVLEGELAAALAEVQRRDEKLAQLRETHSEITRELRERVRTAQEKAKQLETELEQVRTHTAAAEEDAQRERRSAEEERGRQLDSMREERDAATAARNRAEAEAEAARADRDEALGKLTAATSERDALTEARDRAREERNAWMSRARATAASARGKALIPERVPPPQTPSPPQVKPDETQVIVEPAAERRTIRIGERPGPLRAAPPPHDLRPPGERWTPRLVALLALGAFVIVVVLLLLFAF
jgi:TolA-binding protein